MSYFPLLVNFLILSMMAIVAARTHTPNARQVTYQRTAEQMIAYHQAALVYLDANHSATGTIPRTTIDAALPAGITDPGTFTSVVTPPGTVTTYMNSANTTVGNVSQIIQRLSAYNIYAGIVQGGNIIPLSPQIAVTALGSPPTGTVAIQTVERNN